MKPIVEMEKGVWVEVEKQKVVLDRACETVCGAAGVWADEQNSEEWKID